jgi:hypothetical protein
MGSSLNQFGGKDHRAGIIHLKPHRIACHAVTPLIDSLLKKLQRKWADISL